jgi:lysophospholipase L1-like esterase
MLSLSVVVPSEVRQESERLLDIPKPKRARRILLVLVGVIVALSLMEFPAFINVVDYNALIGPLRGSDGTRIFDPELLWIHRPNAHYKGAITGGDITGWYKIPSSDATPYQWDVKYDHNGFRNDIDLKAAGTVVLGDSFVEEIQTPTAQLMTSLLAHLQGEVVANLGQSGYGPQQELLVLKRYGLPLRPHTVVWMFFEGNDLWDEIHYRQWTSHPPSFWHGFYARSLTRNLSHLLMSSLKPKRPGIERAGVVQTGNGNAVTVYFPAPGEPLTKEDLRAIDETAAIIKAAYNLSAAQGAHLIFVFEPDKFRVFHDFCEFPQQSECRNWVVNDMPERVQKAVQSISPDIGYLDLTPYFMSAVKQGGIPYYPDDAHWTSEGHRIAAEAIHEYLLSTDKRRLPD